MATSGKPSFEALPDEPLSDDYGFGRGTPVDRRYIEAFLSAHRECIRGAMLEVGDRRYTTQFGGELVTSSDIVDVDPSNEGASICADLCRRDALPADAFDCIILTETLHMLPEPGVAIRNCERALRTGGSLLLTTPVLKRMSPDHPDVDYWRFTPTGIELLFGRHWHGDFSVRAFGTLRTCAAFLVAAVAEDLDDSAFATQDERFPLTVAVHARRTGDG